MIITIVLAIIALWFVQASAATIECAEGSYDAGGFCKDEPTGCPYGDSIPVDSPKCVAPTTPKLAENGTLQIQNTSDGAVPTEEVWGK